MVDYNTFNSVTSKMNETIIISASGSHSFTNGITVTGGIISLDDDNTNFPISMGLSGTRNIYIGNTSSILTISGTTDIGTDADDSVINIGTNGLDQRNINIGVTGLSLTTISGVINIGCDNNSDTISLATNGSNRALNLGLGNAVSPSITTINGVINLGVDQFDNQINIGTNSLSNRPILIGYRNGNVSTTTMLGLINLATDSSSDEINIGTSGSRIINIGNADATLNIVGLTLSSLGTAGSAFQLYGILDIGIDDVSDSISIGINGSRTITIGNDVSSLSLNGPVNINTTETTEQNINIGTTGFTNLVIYGQLNCGTDANNDTINIGTDGSRNINIGNVNASVTITGLSIPSLGSAGNPFQLYGELSIGTDNVTDYIKIGSAGARAITLGNSTATLTVAGIFNLGTGTDTAAINIGTGSSGRTTSLGNITNGSTTNINGVTININTTATVTTTVMTIGNASVTTTTILGKINLGNDTANDAINIGTSATTGGRPIVIGNSVALSTLSLLSPTITMTAATALNITAPTNITGTTTILGVFNVGTTATDIAGINIGTNANTGGRAITIGNSVTGTVLNLLHLQLLY